MDKDEKDESKNQPDKTILAGKLTPEEYHVTQEKGTEKPFQNAFWDKKDSGMYKCKVCGQTLFTSDAKLDSSKGPSGLQGWPAFEDAIPGTVEYRDDDSMGMHRTEVVCSRCKAHLGHLFNDKEASTGKHFCMNSCALDFDQKNESGK